MDNALKIPWPWRKKKEPRELDRLIQQVEEVLEESDETAFTICNELLTNPKTPDHLKAAITKLGERISDRD